jgi:hypothetical protein
MTQGDLFGRIKAESFKGNGMDAEETLSEARARLREQIFEDGMRCPCCDKWCKVQPRPINPTQCRILIWLVEAAGPERRYVDVPKEGPAWVQRTKQHTTLRHWGLVERPPSTDPDRKHSGLWRPTERGRAFAMDALAIPKRVAIYNDTVLGFRGPHVTIREVFANGKGFSYREAMNEIVGDEEAWSGAK